MLDVEDTNCMNQLFPLRTERRTVADSLKSVYQSVYTHSVLSGCPVFHKAYYIYLRLSYILASKWQQGLESTQCKMIHASAYHLQTEILYLRVGFADIQVKIQR